MKLLSALLLIIGARTTTVDPARFVAAVEATQPPAGINAREWHALEAAVAIKESALEQRIADHHCRPRECDRGRAKGLWQLHANTLNRDAWARMDGDIELQAQEASKQLARGYWTCRAAGVPWYVATINGYAGRRCGDTDWAGLGQRVAVFRSLR